MLRAALIACAILMSSTVCAKERYLLSRSPVSDLLPQDSPIELLIDSHGFLWVETLLGLHRFDGYRLETLYRFSNVTGAPLYETVLPRLLEDPQGRIWFTDSQRLMTYKPELRGFSSTIEAREFTLEEVVDTGIAAMRHDGNRTIWISTRSGAVHRIDTEVMQPLPSIDTSAYLGVGDYIVGISEALNEDVWLASANGYLFRCRGKRYSCEQRSIRDLSEKLRNASIKGVDTYSQEAIVLATKTRGFYKLETSRDEIELLTASIEGVVDTTSQAWTKDGELWVGTNLGVFAFSENAEIARFTPENSKLVSPYVETLHEAYDKVLLVGTFDGLYVAQKARFESFGKEQGLLNTFVTSFAQDSDTSVIAGTFGGLYELDLNDRSISYLEGKYAQTELRSSSVTSLASVGDELWIGYVGEGIQQIDIARESEVSQDTTDNGPKNVSCIEPLSESTVAVCDYERGVFLFKHDADGSDQVTVLSIGPTAARRNSIISAAALPEGSIAAASAHGIFVFNSEEATGTSRVTQYLPEADTMPIRIDSRGIIWVGTLFDGLYNWVPDSTGELNFKKVTTKPPLPDESVYAIEEDSLGMIWLSTNNGLVRLDPDSKNISIYDRSDGLLDEEFNFGASFKDDQGYLYFGGNHGFSRFDPRDFVTARTPPPLRLTEIAISNEPVTYDPAYVDIPELVLNHNDHTVDFEFSTMDIISPGRSRYKYMLQGFHGDWVDIGRRNTATFTSLPAGNYRLRVIGANSDGVWNYDGISLPIRVLPAPWLTWWAFTLYGLAALALITLIKRYYDTRVLKEAAAKQAKSMTITATQAMDDLRDQLMVEQRLVGNLRRHATETMDTLAELLSLESEEIDDPLALETLGRTRQRLQCLRALESGVDFHRDILKVNFRDTVDGVFAGIIQAAPEHECEIVLANECTETLVPIDVAMPLVVLTHELMTNSVVHAFEGAVGIECITVRFDERREEGVWQLELLDSGPGLPSNISPDHPTTLGMEVVKRSVQKLNAEMAFDNAPGARFIIKIPSANFEV